jgi:addiction module RelE/StbE family toxin
MPAKVTISFALSAVTDLEDIQAYYNNEKVPHAGKRLTGEIIAQIERLADHPLSGRIVPELNVEHLREIIHPPFRIVYRYDKKRVRIVRICRSERHLKMPKLQLQSFKCQTEGQVFDFSVLISFQLTYDTKGGQLTNYFKGFDIISDLFLTLIR